MTISEILNYRLFFQNIFSPQFTAPQDIVHWFCGIQAQDYPNSKWGIGLRIPTISDADVEKAILERSIIRTWMFRGTLHLVSARDIHWLLKLLSKKILQAGTSRNRLLGLDDKTLKKCLKLLSVLLADGKEHTRNEVGDFLKNNGIQLYGNILSHILHSAAFNGLICFGPKKGNEFTFLLLDTINKDGREKTREEALHSLASRYFNSHGPANIDDFAWWSGLGLNEARFALETAKSQLISDKFDGKEYWLSDSSVEKSKDKNIYLLPAFDSYLIAYRERSIYLDNPNISKVISNNGIFRPILVQEGKITGIWSRSLKKNKLMIETQFFKKPDKEIKQLLMKNANHFAAFLQKEQCEVSINSLR